MWYNVPVSIFQMVVSGVFEVIVVNEGQFWVVCFCLVFIVSRVLVWRVFHVVVVVVCIELRADVVVDVFARELLVKLRLVCAPGEPTVAPARRSRTGAHCVETVHVSGLGKTLVRVSVGRIRTVHVTHFENQLDCGIGSGHGHTLRCRQVAGTLVC